MNKTSVDQHPLLSRQDSPMQAASTIPLAWPNDRPVVIMVSSYKGGDGTSTVAALLAAISACVFGLKTTHFQLTDWNERYWQRPLQRLGISTSHASVNEVLAYQPAPREIVIVDMRHVIARDTVNTELWLPLMAKADIWLVPGNYGSDLTVDSTEDLLRDVRTHPRLLLLYLAYRLCINGFETIHSNLRAIERVAASTASARLYPEFIPHYDFDALFPESADAPWPIPDVEVRYTDLLSFLLAELGIETTHE